MATDLQTKEINGLEHYMCPTCSKAYAKYDTAPTYYEDGRVKSNGELADVPRSCKRCKGPMDITKALAYGEQLAEQEHQPNLTAIGNKMRGM